MAKHRNQTVRPEHVTEEEIKADAEEAARCVAEADAEASAAVQPLVDALKNGDTPPQEKEPKDAKFFRLAVKRVPAAIKRLRHVANLANKNQYEYTPEHAAKIIDTLRAELKALENAFTGTKAPVEAWTL